MKPHRGNYIAPLFFWGAPPWGEYVLLTVMGVLMGVLLGELPRRAAAPRPSNVDQMEGGSLEGTTAL